MTDIIYLTSPQVSNEALNALFDAAWKGHQHRDFQPILQRSLTYMCAYSEEVLVGFVNVAWDGGVHAFLLDTTVHRDFQRQGIGQQLVQEAIREARRQGCHWLHVDFEPHLESFYRACGFQDTRAGLIQLQR
ncbi:GNAT family N-acetyltransferase [Deinococcus cellulosilyticus]|uniref:N-acetyltransferase n=1 Tax=Deinococcus cellulosilyticus (strain DSM 18568 / NBRC 106333 / KACC 11606 / 5516J-15) TaxID=1223518 RepID=A0A511N2K4_DEIC1|nr:GNAT family N-acetyltransferase [Deinococcus cellulosilyticus]GEM47089.1 N-acetyltransferase [Deinococcus cellulosilyticus NBRC 106333 = KACC 11606]